MFPFLNSIDRIPGHHSGAACDFIFNVTSPTTSKTKGRKERWEQCDTCTQWIKSKGWCFHWQLQCWVSTVWLSLHHHFVTLSWVSPAAMQVLKKHDQVPKIHYQPIKKVINDNSHFCCSPKVWLHNGFNTSLSALKRMVPGWDRQPLWTYFRMCAWKNLHVTCLTT